MSAALVFVGEFYESDDRENPSVIKSKVAIDVSQDAPEGFHEFFETIDGIDDDNYDRYEDDERIWEDVFYHSVEDLVFDHPDYFTIRWFEGVEVEPNLRNLSYIQYVA